MAALTPSVVRTARGRIEVASAGAGPAVLVVHGLPGDWRQARSLVDTLPGCRVLLVSRPGYGRTPVSSGRTAADQASLYAALLDELEIPDAAVVGISGGGPSAFAFAAGHPSRTRGLVLACALAPHLMAVPPGMKRLASVPGLWSLLNSLVRAGARLRPPTAPDASTFTEHEQQLLNDPRVLADLTTFTAERPATLRGKGMRNDVRNLGIEAAGLPSAAAVVLHGDADDVVPITHGEHYASVIPGAVMVPLPGLGHSVPLFARQQLCDAVLGLIGREPDPAR